MKLAPHRGANFICAKQTNSTNEKIAMYEICILLHLILNKIRNFSKVFIFILYNKSRVI